MSTAPINGNQYFTSIKNSSGLSEGQLADVLTELGKTHARRPLLVNSATSGTVKIGTQELLDGLNFPVLIVDSATGPLTLTMNTADFGTSGASGTVARALQQALSLTQVGAAATVYFDRSTTAATNTGIPAALAFTSDDLNVRTNQTNAVSGALPITLIGAGLQKPAGLRIQATNVTAGSEACVVSGGALY